jgi:multidrug efflux pump subunit AcrA (membrane-fusion protein)
VIPAAAALSRPDGGTYVMIAGSDGKAHQKAIKTGIKQGYQLQVLDGVAEGDRIIASGAYGLPDNTKIRVESTEESGKTDHPSAGKETEKDAQ